MDWLLFVDLVVLVAGLVFAAFELFFKFIENIVDGMYQAAQEVKA